MLDIKILQKEDLNILKTLFAKNPRIFNGYTDMQYQAHLLENAAKILNDKLFFNVGVFNKNNLVGVIILKEFSTAPAWCWAHHLCETQGFLFDNAKEFKNLVISLDKIIFDEMENKRNLNRWHFAYNAEKSGVRSVGGIERFLKFGQAYNVKNPEGSKYHFCTECILEPNSMPKYDYQKNMILNRTWPIKIGIRSAFKIRD